MIDLLAAIGLVFVIEGSLLALYPDYFKKMYALVMELPKSYLRFAGLTGLTFGFLIVLIAKRFLS